MASQERTKTTNANLRKLGILALGASLTLAACGTSQVLMQTVDTSADRQSVLRDPENPQWSHTTATVVTREGQAVLRDPENPYWSRNTAAPAADDTVKQPAPRPY